MAKKVSNFSDLVQRVTASCLLHPLGSNRFHQVQMTPDRFSNNNNVQDDETTTISSVVDDDDDNDDDDDEHKIDIYEDARETQHDNNTKSVCQSTGSCENETLIIINQLFDSISTMKRAYGKLQEAHSPWDPEKMRVADEEVVAELRRMAVLRERFRRSGARKKTVAMAVETVREVVAPYEATVDELKREVKMKEEQVVELREKVKCLSVDNNHGKKNGRSRKKGSLSFNQVSPVPTTDMFEATMSQVREKSKSFTSHLLSLMRSAHWDISAAIRSIESAMSTTTTNKIITIPHHHHQAKHALESYILRKIFQGFDHETFYMDGTLSSLLNPSQFRQDCFSKYRDMKSMDPSELLGILPNCPFGMFSSKKYQDIVHPKMEESLFGNLDQRNQLLGGTHPRTQFYIEFLGLAKAIWLLHLLAFSLDPAPSHFEASRGAEFHQVYMESVVRFPGGTVPSGQVVGFPVSPGFKLGNGSVVKARVYLVPRN